MQCSDMGSRPWEQLLMIDSPKTVELLGDAKKLLRTTWQYDCESAKHYPINTAHALAQIKLSLAKKHTDRNIEIELPEPRKPKALTELIPESAVKAVWENYHSGSFEEAIGLAGEIENDKESWKAFQSIIHAMELAYFGRFVGVEVLGMPKVNFLHAGLDQIAKVAGLGIQTEKGFAGFLDDLCPCGLSNHKEAVRKLLSRSSRIRRPKW